MAAFETLLQENLNLFSPARTEPGAVEYGDFRRFGFGRELPSSPLLAACSMFQGSSAGYLGCISAKASLFPGGAMTTRFSREQTHECHEAWAERGQSRSGRSNLIYTKHQNQERVLGNRDLTGIVKLAYAAGGVLIKLAIRCRSHQLL